jgi:hypothetical protein
MLELEQISEAHEELKFTVVVLEMWLGRSLFKSGALLWENICFASRGSK